MRASESVSLYAKSERESEGGKNRGIEREKRKSGISPLREKRHSGQCMFGQRQRSKTRKP